MSSIASDRLREMLNWWKWLCLAREIASLPHHYPHLQDPRPFLRRWRQYERMVLDNSIEHALYTDWHDQRGAFPYESSSSFYWRLYGVRDFPCELFEWNRTSRRAFHIPEGLQCLFMAGDYSSWKWEDLLWPYESVVLTLERPLEVEDEPGCWSSYDAILIAHVVHPNRGKVLLMRMLKKPHGPRPEMLPIREMNQIDKYLATGDRIRASKIASRIEDLLITDMEVPQGAYSGPMYATYAHPVYPGLKDHIRIESGDFPGGINADIPLQPRSTEAEAWKRSVLSMARKIVVGWCAYMGHLHHNAFETVRQSSERGTRGITGVITSPEHICMMLLKARLDPGRYYETREYEVSSGMFKRPHWRRGHWKRANGAPPTAPRTIRVPPMLIRWDLVPIFGIISGTETYIDDDGDI